MTRSDRVAGGRGPAAARLVSRVEPLMGADRTTVTRRPGRESGGLSWLVVPSVRRPLVLLPPTAPAAAHLLRPSGTGKRSHHLRVLAGLQRRRWLRRLPLPVLTVRSSGDSPHLLTALQLVFPDVVDVAVRLGRPRHNRPWVLLAISRGGDVAAVVKVAGGEARAALEREYENLVRVGVAGVPGLRSPAPLGYWRVGALDLLAMEPLLSEETQTPRPVPVQVMRALAQVDGTTRQRIDASQLFRSMRRRADELADSMGQHWLAAALGRMVDQVGDVELPLGTWHGDWVPWNMARRSAHVLVWDWEHMERHVPLGWDHAHYLAQDLRGRVGLDGAAEQRWLQEATEALTDDWQLDRRQALVSLLLYLVEVNLRFLADRRAEGGNVVERRGWSRSLIESLLDDTRLTPSAGGGTR